MTLTGLGGMAKLGKLRPRLGTLDARTGAVLPPMTSQEADTHRRVQYDKARVNDPIRKLYKTRQWQELRRDLYVERGGRCECGCGRLTVLYEREATSFTPVAVFDHIEGARERPDLFWSRDHIRLMAKPCHDARTAREQGFARRW